MLCNTYQLQATKNTKTTQQKIAKHLNNIEQTYKLELTKNPTYQELKKIITHTKQLIKRKKLSPQQETRLKNNLERITNIVKTIQAHTKQNDKTGWPNIIAFVCATLYLIDLLTLTTHENIEFKIFEHTICYPPGWLINHTLPLISLCWRIITTYGPGIYYCLFLKNIIINTMSFVFQPVLDLFQNTKPPKTITQSQNKNRTSIITINKTVLRDIIKQEKQKIKTINLQINLQP